MVLWRWRRRAARSDIHDSGFLQMNRHRRGLFSCVEFNAALCCWRCGRTQPAELTQRQSEREGTREAPRLSDACSLQPTIVLLQFLRSDSYSELELIWAL